MHMKFFHAELSSEKPGLRQLQDSLWLGPKDGWRGAFLLPRDVRTESLIWPTHLGFPY